MVKSYCIFFCEKKSILIAIKRKNFHFFVLFYVCIRNMFTDVNSVNISTLNHPIMIFLIFHVT